MASRVLIVLLVLAVGRVFSYDLSGIHVHGNRFLNNAGQEVVLKVRMKLENNIIGKTSELAIQQFKFQKKMLVELHEL